MKKFDKAKTNNKKWYVIKIKQYTFAFWLLPLLPFVMLYNKVEKAAYKRRVWSDERATKVLDHILPRVLEWVEEDNTYCYCMEWLCSDLWRNARLVDRKWAHKFGYKLHNFIKDGYKNPHYSKSVESDGYETWVKFEEV